MKLVKRPPTLLLILTLALAAGSAKAIPPVDDVENPNQVLEWNQIFIDTLIATNTANSASQRLGAIVHTSIFDAYNGMSGVTHRSTISPRPQGEPPDVRP